MSNQESKGSNPLGALLSKHSLELGLRAGAGIALPARENLKSLLNSSPNQRTEAISQSDLGKIFPLFIQDFSSRQNEWLKLNRARREQIENRIHALGRLEKIPTLNEILHADDQSPLGLARSLFIRESATFHFLQTTLLLKLDIDGHISHRPPAHTVNWCISHALKKLNPQRAIDRSEWGFLKQNLYSWFNPSLNVWQQVCEWGKATIPTLSSLELFSQIISYSESNQEAKSKFSRLGWQWLNHLIGREHENRAQFDVWGESLATTLPESYLQLGEKIRIQASSQDDFTRYTLEMLGVWLGKFKDFPLIVLSADKNLSSGISAYDLKRCLSPFSHGIGCSRTIAEALPTILNGLSDSAFLAITSQDYIATDNSDFAAKVRELLLKNTTILGIFDLRSVLDNQGGFPKIVILAQKTSSREIRDCHRPLIIKIRGAGSELNLDKICVESFVRMESGIEPGQQIELVDRTNNLKCECMAAAASQQSLRSQPWTSIADPEFYALSNALRRLPTKAFNTGNLIRWKSTEQAPTLSVGKSIYLSEETAKHIEANTSPSPHAKFLYILDKSTQESAAYFSAVINSRPIQFWYQLELENELFTVKSKNSRRQAEQILKLMPVLKLFDSGALIPALIDFSTYDPQSLENCLTKALSNQSPSLHTRQEIQSVVVEASRRLENSISNLQNMGAILYPNLKFKRASLPVNLPEISPAHALQALSHLPQVPLPQHPAFQIIPLRTISDFKLTNIKLAQGHGPFSELIFYHGADAVLRLHGPTIFILATMDLLQNRIGKTWSETKQRLLFPLDVSMVVSQIKQMELMLKSELESANFYCKLIDATVCTLAGFSTIQESYDVVNRIKSYLQPSVTNVATTTTQDHSVFKSQIDSVGTTSILQ